MGHLDDDLLKPNEIADRLGVSRSWVYDAAKAGRIPCVRTAQLRIDALAGDP